MSLDTTVVTAVSISLHASAYACVVITFSLVIKSHREFGQESIRLDSQSACLCAFGRSAAGARGQRDFVAIGWGYGKRGLVST